MARKPRSLTDEDARLWNRVIASTTPMADRKPASLRAADPADGECAGPKQTGPVAKLAKQTEADKPDWLLKPFRPGAAAAPPRSQAYRQDTTSQQLHDAPLRMDPHAHRRLRKGKLTPEARIDLHGMTLAVAQPALMMFILRAHAAQQRLVLVITGKGRGGNGDPGPLPTRPGVLRHSVPHWLQLPPLSQVVAQVLPAHDRHGGGGAYYVWLRKSGR